MQTKFIKIISLGCIALTMLAASCSPTFPSGWDAEGLKGKVKTTFERKYTAEQENGEWVTKELSKYGHYKMTFTKEGQLTVSEFYNDLNEVEYKEFWEYNDAGNEIQIKAGNTGEEWVIKVRQVSKNKSELEELDKHGEVTVKGESLWQNNRVVKTSMLMNDHDGKQSEKIITYDFDKNNNLLAITRTNENGEVTWITKYVYLTFDDKGNWVKNLVYENDSPPLISMRDIEYYE